MYVVKIYINDMSQQIDQSKLIGKLLNVLEREHIEGGVKIEHIRKALLEFDISKNEVLKSNRLSDLFDEHSKSTSNQLQSQVIKTGLEEYDSQFGGLWPGEFVVIGGRPAMGKSQLLANLAVNIAIENEVLFYTLDMSSFMLTARIVAALTQLPINYYLHGDRTEVQNKMLELAKNEIDRLKLRILDQQSQSMTAFKELCAQHVKDYGVKVIFVDYLQLLSSNRYRNSRELEISYISRELKNIARDLNVCVVATSQLSRSVEQRGGDKRPILSDLRESGAIEQDADKVIFVYRPAYYGFLQDEDGNNVSNLVELIVSKNRSGSLGSIRLKVDEMFTTFSKYEDTQTYFNIEERRLSDFNDDNDINETPF